MGEHQNAPFAHSVLVALWWHFCTGLVALCSVISSHTKLTEARLKRNLPIREGQTPVSSIAVTGMFGTGMCTQQHRREQVAAALFLIRRCSSSTGRLSWDRMPPDVRCGLGQARRCSGATRTGRQRPLLRFNVRIKGSMRQACRLIDGDQLARRPG